MKAVILAAGYATRLYPLTLNHPKPLLEIGQKPLMEYILERINQVTTVDEIFIVTNNKFYPLFLEWASKRNGMSSKPLKIINDGTLTNEDRLGAIGDLHFVLNTQNIKDDILLIAGDNLFDFSLADLVTHFNRSNLSTLALYDLKEPQKLAKKFGVAQIDHTQKILELEEKPESPKTSLAATCCYVFRKEDCARIEEYLKTGSFDNPGSLGSWLVKSVGLMGFTFAGSWYDIGSFESLKEAREKYGGASVSRQ